MSKLMKWSGSKNSQSDKIIEVIPKDIKIYIEPFVGGGSVFLKLLETDSNINKYIISDINVDLINIYKMIEKDPKKIIDKYKIHYNLFNKGDISDRKEYFYKIRNEYNINHNPEDFYWIMRTTTNGMPRYNRKKEFNNSCHFNRPGMSPDKVETIINYYSNLFNKNDITFLSKSYESIEYPKDSIIYFDPPYENTKGMYFNEFENDKFIEYINGLTSKWILSYDGKVNDDIISHISPEFKTHLYLDSGNSSFRRILGNSKDSIVKESLYLNYTI